MTTYPTIRGKVDQSFDFSSLDDSHLIWNVCVVCRKHSWRRK